MTLNAFTLVGGVFYVTVGILDFSLFFALGSKDRNMPRGRQQRRIDRKELP